MLEERDFVIFDLKKWCGIIREKEEVKRYRSINSGEYCRVLAVRVFAMVRL